MINKKFDALALGTYVEVTDRKLEGRICRVSTDIDGMVFITVLLGNNTFDVVPITDIKLTGGIENDF